MLDLGEGEAAFGLVIRDKCNHDNYIFLSFENIEEILEAFNDLKKQFDDKAN